MKARTLTPALAVAVLAFGAAPPSPTEPQLPGPAWFEGSVPGALAEAGRRGTLVFLDFSPDW